MEGKGEGLWVTGMVRLDLRVVVVVVVVVVDTVLRFSIYMCANSGCFQ